MKQESNDNVIKVTTEWEQYEVHLNWDCCCDDMIRHFCDILHGMTYGYSTIIDSLKNVAELMEEEVRYCKINDENLDDYGTTD